VVEDGQGVQKDDLFQLKFVEDEAHNVYMARDCEEPQPREYSAYNEEKIDGVLGTIRSETWHTKFTVTIENRSDNYLAIDWINYEGGTRPSGGVKAGGKWG